MLAETFDQIYDVEPVIETALKTLFEAQQIAGIRTTDAGTDFQKVRPRVEIEYIHSDMNQSNHNVGPYYRSRLFGGQLNLLLVTNSRSEADGGTLLHRQIRARVRNIMAKLRHDLIHVYPELLPYHTVANVQEQGTAPTITPQDGVLTSNLSFEFQVNVKPDAWPPEQ